MENIKLIHHHPGAPLLRLFGLGSGLIPVNGISQLKILLKENTFWAKKRSKKQLREMIKNSSAIVTLWINQEMIGFGRATSDEIYRAVLWDIVIADNKQNLGLGKLLVDSLIKSKSIKHVEKVYLMTTNHKDFYQSCGFIENDIQTLLIKNNNI